MSKPYDQMTEEEFELLSTDPRATIYRNLDAALGIELPDDDAEEEEEPPVDEEGAEESEEPREEEEPTRKAADTPPETPEPEVLTREEFLERFRNIRVRAKVAGEEPELSPEELLKLNGLERHLTKQLQETAEAKRSYAKREEELLKAATGAAGAGADLNEDGTKPLYLWTPQEVREYYDDIVRESPYEAQRFLKEAEQAKSNAFAEMHRRNAESALAELKDAVPDLKEEDWLQMNDPVFYRKYPSIVRFKEQGDYRACFFTAHAHLVRERVEAQLAERERESQRIADMKRKGSVTRTVTTPERGTADTSKQSPIRSDVEEIRYRQALQRKRMGLG